MHDTVKRQIPDWQEKYRSDDVETMPWYFEGLDPDIGGAIERWKIVPGNALDLGTGPGTQAVALAELGFTVTATDVAHSAVEKARSRFDGLGLRVCFVQDDILSTGLTDSFDVVVDRGVFHVFPPERRHEYLETIARIVKPEGYLLLKCFSHKETMEEGPYRFTAEELREYFEQDFDVVEIVETKFHGTLDRFPIALFATLRKKKA